jgi:phage/plasmid-like protein (TIGR03299 family)
MAHEISINAQGKAEIAYSGETPWHGLGTRVEGLQTAQDIIKAAGLEWSVGLEPVSLSSSSPFADIEGYRAIVRQDNRKVFGITSDRYVPIQNVQAADVLDALVTEGGAHVEVAGALFEGRRCWALAHIPQDFEVVRGDLVKPYVLLAWGHDGKHGLAAKLTPIRVVCNNTLTAAGLGGGQKWSESADVYVRHTGDAKIHVEAAQKALGLVRKQVAQTAEAYLALAGRGLGVVEAKDYFAGVFPVPDESIVLGPKDEEPNASVHAELYEAKLARWNEHQAKLLALYEQGAGHSFAAGTAWGAYNAVTEWADHVYPVKANGEVSATRQQSVLFGQYAEIKGRALTSALALVG